MPCQHGLRRVRIDGGNAVVFAQLASIQLGTLLPCRARRAGHCLLSGPICSLASVRIGDCGHSERQSTSPVQTSGKWRTERDSNPRTAFTVTHFPGVRLQPLGHLSTRPGRRPERAGTIATCARPASRETRERVLFWEPHQFRNFGFQEIYDDLRRSVTCLRFHKNT